MEICYVMKGRGIPLFEGCEDTKLVRNPDLHKVKAQLEEYLKMKKVMPQDASLELDAYNMKCNKRGFRGRVKGRFTVIREGMKLGRGSFTGDLLCTMGENKLLTLTANVYPLKRPRPLRK